MAAFNAVNHDILYKPLYILFAWLETFLVGVLPSSYRSMAEAEYVAIDSLFWFNGAPKSSLTTAFVGYLW